jgi:phosphate starvation-inducible membrane PsiE
MNKKEIEYNLSMKPLVIPSSLYLGCILLFLSNRINEGGLLLILFIVSWFITGEFKIFKVVNAYRLKSIGYYSMITVLCVLGMYFELVALIILSFLLILCWAYYSSLVYKNNFLS